MKEMNYREKLIGLVDQFLEGRLEFDAFATRYIECFVEEVPDNYFGAAEFEVMGQIHEKAEWTTEAPPVEDRRDGWLDIPEFKDWLQVHRRSLGGQEP